MMVILLCQFGDFELSFFRKTTAKVAVYNFAPVTGNMIKKEINYIGQDIHQPERHKTNHNNHKPYKEVRKYFHCKAGLKNWNNGEKSGCAGDLVISKLHIKT
jgi:hypothetical protein